MGSSSRVIDIEMGKIINISEEVQSNHSDSDDICRICHDHIGIMITPCLCNGTLKFVHQECVKEWIKRSRKLQCTICQFQYKTGYQISVMKFLKFMNSESKMALFLLFLVLLAILIIVLADFIVVKVFFLAVIVFLPFPYLVKKMHQIANQELTRMWLNGLGEISIKNVSDEERMVSKPKIVTV